MLYLASNLLNKEISEDLNKRLIYSSDWVDGKLTASGSAALLKKNLQLKDCDEKTKITNEISENEKIWFFRECLAFVSTSKLEGFGIPAIEAMRFGKPVFLSNMTSFPEVAGTEAHYWENFDPEVMKKNFENGMNQFYNDSEKTKRIYNHSLKFSWKITIDKYKTLYKELL